MEDSNVPNPTSVRQIDMSEYCSWDESSSSPAFGEGALEHIDFHPLRLLRGRWLMPEGSVLTPTGDAGWLQVTSGSVNVVSCGGPLRYKVEPDPTPFLEAAAGTGVTVDASFVNGIFFSVLGDAKVAVAASNGEDGHLVLEVAGDPEILAVNTNGVCWTCSDARIATLGGPYEPQPCGLFRCWTP